MAHPQVRDVALCTFPQAGRGAGIYAFVETSLDPQDLRRLISEQRVELVQPVEDLPRDADGRLRDDALHLIAMNRIDEIALLRERDPDLAAVLAPIVAGRANLTDRQ